MDYKKFWKTLKKIHFATGKKRFSLTADIILCGLKYQAGCTDYALFEMYDMTKEERKTVLTRGKNNDLIKKLNNPQYNHIFHNKNEFNKKFTKYLNREWFFINNNEEQFYHFLERHPIFIAKPIDLECGKGIEKINSTNHNKHELYQNLQENNQLLIEEVAIQCKSINDLHPYSINTIRIVTLNQKVAAAFIRIGDHQNIVDNFNHDGLLAPINIETGVIDFPAVKKDGSTYTHHPLTAKKILGFQIPCWEEAKKMCIEASKVAKEIDYIGFDVCIGPEKCFLIEANEFPGHDLYALPGHRNKKEGMLPHFEKILNSNHTNFISKNP